MDVIRHLPLAVHRSRWTRRISSWLWWPVWRVWFPCSPHKTGKRRCSPHWTLRPGRLWTGKVHLETGGESFWATCQLETHEWMNDWDFFLSGVTWRTYFDWTTVCRTTPSTSTARLRSTCRETSTSWGEALIVTAVCFYLSKMLKNRSWRRILPQFIVFLWLASDAVICLLEQTSKQSFQLLCPAKIKKEKSLLIEIQLSHSK